MTQVVIKKEKPCILTEEFFEAGMFVVGISEQSRSDEVYITLFNQDKEVMLLISLLFGTEFVFADNKYEQFAILEKGTVLEITV